MPVRPSHFQGVISDKLEFGGNDIIRNRRGIEDALAGHFVDAHGARTRRPQQLEGDAKHVVAIPFDFENSLDFADAQVRGWRSRHGWQWIASDGELETESQLRTIPPFRRIVTLLRLKVGLRCCF